MMPAMDFILQTLFMLATMQQVVNVGAVELRVRFSMIRALILMLALLILLYPHQALLQVKSIQQARLYAY